jgi:hypothetical protein
MMPPGMRLAMGTTAATDQVKHELNRALDNMRAEIDRIEILVAALDAFKRPVPDYEPGFRHTRQLAAHELKPAGGR